MKSAVRQWAAFAAALAFAAPAVAHAYGYNTCGGEKVVWDDPFAMVQNVCSIPVDGAREDAMLAGIGRWNNIGGMSNMISMSSGVNPFCTIVHDDGVNDVAVVTRAAIDGHSGLCIKQHDGCFLPGDKEWTEADVMVASDLSMANPAETDLVDNGIAVFVHEFGHSLGLEHDDDEFTIMREHAPYPLIGGSGSHVDTLPDDADGGRFLYPQLSFETNLFSTAHRLDAGTITTNTGPEVFTCAGQGGPITILATVGNNGTSAVTQTERWYVSTSSTAYGGTLIYTWTNSTFNAETTHTRWVTMTIPALSAGTYFLFHKVDALGTVSEGNETDNTARERLVIKVVTC